MRSQLKYTIFSIKSLSEYFPNLIFIIVIHSVKIMRLIIIGNDHDVVKIQSCNHQDLEQRKI